MWPHQPENPPGRPRAQRISPCSCSCSACVYRINTCLAPSSINDCRRHSCKSFSLLPNSTCQFPLILPLFFQPIQFPPTTELQRCKLQSKLTTAVAVALLNSLRWCLDFIVRSLVVLSCVLKQPSYAEREAAMFQCVRPSRWYSAERRNDSFGHQ